MNKQLSVNSEPHGLVLCSRHVTGLEYFLIDINSPRTLIRCVKSIEGSGNSYSSTHKSLLNRIQGVDCSHLFNNLGLIGLFVSEVRIILKAHGDTINPGPSYTSIFEDKGMSASSDLGHNLYHLLMYYNSQIQVVGAGNVFRDAVRFNMYEYKGECLTLLGLGLRLQSQDLVVTSLENGATIYDWYTTDEKAYTVLQEGVKTKDALFVKNLLTYLPGTLSMELFKDYFGNVISYGYNLVIHSYKVYAWLSREASSSTESFSSRAFSDSDLALFIPENNRNIEKHQAVLIELFRSPKIPSRLKMAVIDSFSDPLVPFQLSLKQIFEAGE